MGHRRVPKIESEGGPHNAMFVVWVTDGLGLFQAIKNPPAGFREGFQLVRRFMRELRLPLESPWGP